MTTRKRSYWGWGYADKFPDQEARKGIAEQASAMLGFTGLEAQPAPKIEDIRIPDSRWSVPKSLEAFCSNDTESRAMHTYGRNYTDIMRGFRNDFSNAPDLVGTPRNEQEIQQILDWCHEHHIKVIPYGGGTSVVGGVEAKQREQWPGVLSLDMGQMDQVLEVDSSSQLARIQAGIKGPALEAVLAQQGFTLRHFPQSFEFSTLGGWLATRAGGHFATVYTHIDDLTAGMRMLTPSGIIETSPLPGSGAGPDPNRLMLGSEGTLGIITEGTMRIRPRPTFRARASVHFADFNDAVTATRTLSQSGLFPANCRLLDAREAALHSVTFDNTNVLLLAFESAHLPVEYPIQQAIDICKQYNGVLPEPPKISAPTGEQAASSDKSSAAWKGAFIETPYLFNTMVSLGVLVDTFETACTWDKFEDMHMDIIRSVRKAMKEICGGGRITCRFTHVYPDGPAPYYTFVAPAKVGSEIQQWYEVKTAASEALLRHQATITHHHAVGRVHKPWYQRQHSPLFLKSLQAIKKELDPQGLLNPGVLIEP